MALIPCPCGCGGLLDEALGETVCPHTGTNIGVPDPPAPRVPTEADWLAATNPHELLAQMPVKAGGRKVVLLACACVRALGGQLADERSWRALEVAERCADGLAAPAEQVAAEAAAWAARGDARRKGNLAAGDAAMAVWSITANQLGLRVSGPDAVRHAVSAAGGLGHSAQLALARCVFGNPFHPVAVAMDWLAWKDGLIPRLARALYEERRFEDLPVLADALEEAGCTSEELLGHLRGPGPRCRGCWAVDLLLNQG
jgi:hypothetical protein